MRCSYRTLQINSSGEVWMITQDIRRRKNPRTGERYYGMISKRQIAHIARTAKVRLIIRVKSWKRSAC